MSVMCKCDAGMSVENLTAVVNIKALKGLFIAHEFSRKITGLTSTGYLWLL
jgi:hypothetical protein